MTHLLMEDFAEMHTESCPISLFHDTIAWPSSYVVVGTLKISLDQDTFLQGSRVLSCQVWVLHRVFIPEFVCHRDVPQGRDKASQSFQERTAYIAFLPSPERNTNVVLNCLCLLYHPLGIYING